MYVSRVRAAPRSRDTCGRTQGTEAWGNLPILGAWTIPSMEKTTAAFLLSREVSPVPRLLLFGCLR